MNNYIFLKRYFQLQTAVMFDDIFDLGFALFGYCHDDQSSFWNNTLIDGEIDIEQIKQIEKAMNEHDRKPVLYFENNKSDYFIKLIENLGYTKEYEDSWMFHTGNDLNYNKDAVVKKVENEQDLKIFLEVLNNCYRNNDPQNPYGELGNYLGVAEKVWYQHNQTERVEYFIVYKNRRPVAVTTLTNFDGIGYISNIGSLPEVRGEGYGKVATLFSVEQSVRNGNHLHCLATEEKTYPNEFYKRIGFEVRFTAVGFGKL